MKHLSAALACAVLVTPGIASAADAISSAKDTRVFASVTEADLGEIVTLEGHTLETIQPFDAPSVQGKTGEGIVFLLVGTACDDQPTKQCNGIMMQIRYDSDERVTAEGANKANNNQAAVQTYFNAEEKTVGFSRYMVLDGGVTWMNIRENLRVLLSVAPAASADVFP